MHPCGKVKSSTWGAWLGKSYQPFEFEDCHYCSRCNAFGHAPGACKVNMNDDLENNGAKESEGWIRPNGKGRMVEARGRESIRESQRGESKRGISKTRWDPKKYVGNKIGEVATKARFWS